MDDRACSAVRCHGHAETGCYRCSRSACPADIEAWYEAPIYARVSGYLKAWHFDFGAHVEKGQLLAEIDAPDLDAQLAAARARLVSAQAQVNVREAERNFAETTYARWRDSPRGVVSEQETEAKKAEFGSADARYKASLAEANVNKSQVDQLTALETFKRIVAPFDGIVTSRTTDVGALINAGSGASAGPQLFRVADVHEMRVFVQVPQEQSSDMRAGLTAEVTLPQYPDKTFKAVVSTTSEAINKIARTLLVELHADNADESVAAGHIRQGAFQSCRQPRHDENSDQRPDLPRGRSAAGASRPRQQGRIAVDKTRSQPRNRVRGARWSCRVRRGYQQPAGFAIARRDGSRHNGRYTSPAHEAEVR